MSGEEFRAWQRAFETCGVKGLHANTLQEYRPRTTVPAPSSENTLRQSFDSPVETDSEKLSIDASSPPEKR
jgi:hypothetical protein